MEPPSCGPHVAPPGRSVLLRQLSGHNCASRENRAGPKRQQRKPTLLFSSLKARKLDSSCAGAPATIVCPAVFYRERIL